MTGNIVSCFLMTLTISSLVIIGQSKEELTLQTVERQLLLNGPYPSEQTFIKFQANQDSVTIYRHVVPLDLDQSINKIAFMRNKENKEMFPYVREEYIYDGVKYALYRVDLGYDYAAGEKGEIYIVTVFLNRYVNFPKEITMSEDQKFEFSDNKLFLSPYAVVEQISSYKFDRIISNDKDGEAKGPSPVLFKHKDAKPFAVVNHIVHGVNNDPQIYFSNVNRVIEISHWGNIAITEFYKLKNVGPDHKGEFSRIEFSSRNMADVKHAFRGVESSLPFEAWGLYYRDEVGNVTTSAAFRDTSSRKVRFTLVPRFNLLGGWKANWEVGYNLPTAGYLSSEGNRFQVDNIDLEYALEKILAENYDFTIILPEGCTNIVVQAGGKPIEPTRIDRSFGYLDFFGRPAYVFEGYKGILKKRDITVDYHLDPLSTLYKPLTVFAILFTVLSLSIILKRLRLEAFSEPIKSE